MNTTHVEVPATLQKLSAQHCNVAITYIYSFTQGRCEQLVRLPILRLLNVQLICSKRATLLGNCGGVGIQFPGCCLVLRFTSLLYMTLFDIRYLVRNIRRKPKFAKLELSILSVKLHVYTG
jgi:hypothetical protein